MFGRFLAVLGTIATVVAAVFAVIAYFFPSDQKAPRASVSDSKPIIFGPAVNVSPGAQIKQESRGHNSPNIISGGNVSVGGR